MGSVHVELCEWLQREEANSHQLVLLPRDHGKSRYAAYYVVWRATRDPAIRVLYLSATSTLANKQLKFIKDILVSPIYKFYWPDMVNEDEGKREKWTESEIAVDHPKRKAEYIRDPTVFAAGLTTVVTGLHFDLQIYDDVVIMENAYTEEGRDKTKSQYSLLASTASGKSKHVMVGTRYHPQDLYNDVIGTRVQRYNLETMEPLPEESLYEVFERQVEDRGDGTGQFLWPKQRRYDGTEFGFDANILADKKAQYIDLGQFYAQYYNNPNSIETGGIAPENFQYFDKQHLTSVGGTWFFKDRKLNLIASMDLAYSLSTRADYTSIVVVGVDGHNNYYVLDIDRFKTNLITEYYEHLWSLYKKWLFPKIIIETIQEPIIEDIKRNYIYRDGLALSVKMYRPPAKMGDKEERIHATLASKYGNGQIWHYKGGNCQTLEEELVQRHPPHDDIKDSLATAVMHLHPPTSFAKKINQIKDNFMYHARFGGLN